MAIVDALPENEVIKAFKGTLDFYFWRGVYVVRAWPRKPKMPRSPASSATANTFADIIRAQDEWDPAYHDAAVEQTQGTEWTWRDELVRSLYGNLWHLPTVPEKEESVLVFGQSSPTYGGTTFAVNTTAYLETWELSWFADAITNGYNQVRFWADAWSNQAGQTIDLIIAANQDPGVSITGIDPMLTLTNTPARHDTGWLTFDPTAYTNGLYYIAYKGSNLTVDMVYARLQVDMRKA